jgi:hypothetical protein
MREDINSVLGHKIISKLLGLEAIKEITLLYQSYLMFKSRSWQTLLAKSHIINILHLKGHSFCQLLHYDVAHYFC